MKNKSIWILLSLTFFIISCHGTKTYWTDEIYDVTISPEDPSKKTLYYNFERIGIGRVEWVEKIGSNEDYIIVESRGKQLWILDKEKDDKYFNADQIMIGPLGKSEFDKYKSDLGIDSLEFSSEW